MSELRWCPTCDRATMDVIRFRGTGMRYVCFICANDYEDCDQLNAIYELGRAAGRAEVQGARRRAHSAGVPAVRGCAGCGGG